MSSYKRRRKKRGGQSRYWNVRKELPGFPLTARDKRRLEGSRKTRKQARHKK